MKGDEQKAIDAGCDGYITKPIDTRTLGARIREFLDRRESRDAAPAELPDRARSTVPAAEMQALRRRFLDEGQERARQLLLDLDGQFDADEAARAVHQLDGTGGLLGYAAISRLAREVEAVLQERPLDNCPAARIAHQSGCWLSTRPREARDDPVPDAIVQTLSLASASALVGLPAPNDRAAHVRGAGARPGAMPCLSNSTSPPDSPAVAQCDLVVITSTRTIAVRAWLRPVVHRRRALPPVFVGHRDDLLALDHAVQAQACEFLMDRWQPEEALVRLSLASRRSSCRPGRRTLRHAGARRAGTSPRADGR